jgi:pimeloyl-ACP methyl ester carboxylesterase
MAEFILVHGTFAKHAPWTLEGSELRARIANLSSRARKPFDFTPVPWGGRNRGGDRLLAADAIASSVKTATAKGDSQKIFLIGHSHGGSAIAYFLKLYPKLAAQVEGVAFLSTPFVATRLRPQWQLFLRALLVSAAVGLLILVFAATTWINLLLVPKFYDEIQGLEFLIFPTGVVLGLLITFFGLRALEKRLASYIEHELSARLDRLATVNIPSGNQLYLRAIGDEAAGLLSVAQFFSWIMGTIAAIASIRVGYLQSSSRWLVKMIWGKVLAIVLVLLFGFWVAVNVAHMIVDPIICGMFTHDSCSVTSTLHHWIIPEHVPLGYPSLKWFFGPVDEIVYLISPVFSLVLFLVLSYAALLLVTVSISAISLSLFGWIGLGPALFADFAVEPTPNGPVTLVHVDWRAQKPETVLALNHSKTYANLDALDCLTQWISPRL